MGLKVDTKEVTTVIKNDTKSVTTKGTDNSVSIFNFDNIKEHKEELAIASGIATAGLIGLSLLTRKRLPKHMDFKPAETVEEAIKFSKKSLGIKIEPFKNGSKELNLNALNEANAELVRLSNISEGRIKMPKNIKFSAKRATKNTKDKQGCFKLMDNTIELPIHEYTEISGEGGLVTSIDKLLKARCFTTANGADLQHASLCQGIRINISECLPYEVSDIFERYINKGIISEKELRQLNTYLRELQEEFIFMEENPTYLYHILTKKSIKECESFAPDVLLDKIKEFRYKPKKIDYKNFKFDFDDKYSLDKFYRYFRSRRISPTIVLDHEMGHVQHEKKPFLGMRRFITKKQIWRSKKAYKLDAHRATKECIDFSSKYQPIAAKVSCYATTSINEFLAETYAYLLQGRQFDKDVIDMYLKYGGKIPKGLKDYII